MGRDEAGHAFDFYNAVRDVTTVFVLVLTSHCAYSILVSVLCFVRPN